MNRREVHLNMHPVSTPSQATRPPLFYFDRPPSAAATIPITLYHPVFGRFQDDCESYVPTKEDNTFVIQFSSKMSEFYQTEGARAREARGMLRSYDLHFNASTIESFTTDGDVRYNDFCFARLEVKAELGSSPSDPLVQAGCYYRSFTKQTITNRTNLPCFLIYIAGAHIGFAGAVWSDYPNLQVLAPVLPLFYHATDWDMQMRTARYFGAMKKAIRELEAFYQKEADALMDIDVPPKDDNPAAPMFPHPHQYTSLSDSRRCSFNYVQRLEDKLLFHGRSGGDNICIKFTRRYSKEAHLKCSSLGFAPALRGFEHIEGGWLMVVMDLIDDDTYEQLDDVPPSDRSTFKTEIRRCVRQLHDAGFVHGDIRATNFMVPKGKEETKIMLIDFDWAGKMGEVRYPHNVNVVGVRRSPGAYDGELITTGHDLAMIEFLWV
ncbi:hypothetical protein JB92DRAFT_2882804 [Gautieria morchelliformis]|nr:hypothetical protein JB92DRAFT_2882804 [Gautieria morchelliformis]